ncbi:MAG: Ig domain-containing protein [Halobacteriovoraceae bacterium]|nr:Ig domain-containing protein [Halobacteriovoraceae bacterium]
MRTRNLSLLTLLVFLLTSCMPDSFTKFKEDPPSKKVSSGGSSGSSGTETPEPTATPTATPTPTDVVYEVTSVDFYQSKGDTYIFDVLNGEGFNVGDTVNFSIPLFYSNTETYNFVGTIITINGDTDGETIFAVKLDGAPEVGGAPVDFDYDGNFAGYDTNYSSDAAISYKFIDEGYYIDNCATGFGTCALGTAATSIVNFSPVLYIDPNVPNTTTFDNAVLKAISKRIHIVGSGTDDAADLTWEYTYDTNILGLGVKDLTDGVSTSDAVASDGTATNDRLVSPFGPFTIDQTAIPGAEGLSLGINVKLSSADYGTQLDPEEEGSGSLLIATVIPGDPVEDIQNFELTYYLEDTQRFAIKVDNVSGFVTGLNLVPPRNVVRACRVTIGTGCDTDSETVQVLGKATIDYIDVDQSILYLTASDFDHDGDGSATTGDYHSIFKSGNFIHNGTSAGGAGLSTFVSTQTTHAARIFRDTDSGITISPEYNIPNAAETVDDDPSNTIVYSVDQIPDSGFSINPSTGIITITNPGLVFNSDVTVTATDADNGGVIDDFVLNLNFIGAPSSFVYQSTGFPTASTFQSIIGATVSQDAIAVTDANSDIDELSGDGEAAVNLNFIDYLPTATLPTGVSLQFNRDALRLVYSPSSYDDGATTYTIQGFFPAYDPSAPFGSITANFESATPFANIRYPQSTNDVLILTVEDTASFSTSSGSNSVSSSGGAVGTVLFIDDEASQIYVQVTSNLTGASTFSRGDSLDNTSSYVIERTLIMDEDNAVVHVFTTADANNRFTNPNGLVPELFDSQGNAVSLAGGESLTWAITPTDPADVNFNTSTGGFVAVTDNSLSNLDPTIYTIAATNTIGDIQQTTYAFTIAEAPSRASAGRYQFVRIKGNTNRFYRGSRVQSAPNVDDEQVSGRVLMTVDIDGDGTNDGLLLENNGDLEDNIGIDNTAVYYATEVTVEPYHFIFVKDLGVASIFSVSEQITTDDGNSTAIVQDFDLANDRVYIKVEEGSFDPGDVVTDGTNSTIINSVEDRHYVTGVIEVNNQTTLDAFDVGGPISTDNGTANGVGIVVQKHVDNAYTVNTTGDDRYYLLIQHISGNFAEGDNVDNTYTYAGSEGTIDHIVGPNIDLTIPGGTTFTNGSISGRVDKNGHPFFEGSLIGAFAEANRNYQSVGYSVYGTDYGNNNIRVNVEDFYSHFERGGGTDFYLDDFVQSIAAIQGENHNNISGVTLSNLMIGYVGESFHLEPTIKGEFNSVSLSPEVLPTGLTFDPTTGRITGTPNEPLSGTTYTLSFNSATNVVAPATYAFDLVVYNQFELTHTTEEASSYVAHREGQGLTGSRCKVFGPQVIDDVGDPNYNEAIYGMNDVVCLFEGGESDLYNRGINFAVKAGAGMCEYVNYTPYSYSSFPSGSTDKTITVYNEFDDANLCNNGNSNTVQGTAVDDGLVTAVPATITAGTPLAGRTFDESYCEGGGCTVNDVATASCNYRYGDTVGDWPNLDQGSVTVNTVSCARTEVADDDSDADAMPQEAICTCNYSRTTVDCGGATTNGLDGAKKSTDLTVDEISTITTTIAGTTVEHTVNSPIGESKGSNRYIANYQASRNYSNTSANSCMESKYTMESYSGVGSSNLSTNRALWNGYAQSFDPFGYSSDARYSNFYTFDCLDASFNPKARIRVLVRDWDREFTTEDSEIESVVNFGQQTTATITIGASNHTATLSAALNTDISIGRGSVIFLEDGTNPGYQEDEDTQKYEVASYVPGDTFLTLKTFPSSVAGPVTFHVRSKVNDEASTCFGENCDKLSDHDSRSLELDKIALLNNGTLNSHRPAYESCGDSDISDNLVTYNGSFVAGNLSVTVNAGGIGAADDIPLGMVIVVDFNGNGVIDAGEPHFAVLSGSGTGLTLAADPGFTGTYDFLVVQRPPFPMETI